MNPGHPLGYRADVDGLRAYAVLLVVFFHLNVPYFNGGFVGVDIFFVISGFLITDLILREVQTTGSFSFRYFYRRRFWRLFPALFVTVCFTAAGAILLFSPAHLERLGGAVIHLFAGVSNIYFWTGADYFDVGADVKPLLHTWSLSVEEQFYAIWPCLLVFVFLTNRKAVPWVLISLFGFSLALNGLFAYGKTALTGTLEDTQATLFFWLPFRAYEFAIGGLLVFVVQLNNKQWRCIAS